MRRNRAKGRPGSRPGHSRARHGPKGGQPSCEDIPKTQWNLPRFLWLPAAELYGIQRIEYLDDVLVLSGAGVGGGSHVYANTLYVPPKRFFDAPEWAGITDWADELAPHLDQATRMLGVVRYPYMPTDADRALQQVATEMGRGETFNKAPVGVYFGTPGVEADDPYFGGVGPRRTGCISCGNCNIGCSHNAKNKLTANYLFLAETLGAQVHELHEVYDLVALDGGGFEVHARHPGWAQRAEHLHHHKYTGSRSTRPRHGSASCSNTPPKCSASTMRVTGPSGALSRSTERSSSEPRVGLVLVVRIVSSLAQRSAVSVQRSARVGKHRITAAPQRTRCEFCSHVRQDSQTPRRALRELRNLLTAGCTGIRV